MALLSVAALVGHFSDGARWKRASLAFAALPIAIGSTASASPPRASLPHSWSGSRQWRDPHGLGWLVFVLALGAVWALQKTLGSNAARAGHARLGTV